MALTQTLIKTAGALALIPFLAACIDVTMELEVLDHENARGTTSMTMAKDMYDMSQAQGGEDFCDEEAELTVTDTSVTCVESKEGPYAEMIDAAEGEPAPSIEVLADGNVRVTFPTGTMQDEFGGSPSDAEELAMLNAMFADKFITLVASGGEIVDTNMEVAEDGQSASYQIRFTDLIAGDAELPEESFAIIKLP